MDYAWEWDAGTPQIPSFRPFDPKIAAKIESGFQNGLKKVKLSSGFFKLNPGYFIDLSGKLPMQVNSSTEARRHVRRRDLKPGTSFMSLGTLSLCYRLFQLLPWLNRNVLPKHSEQKKKKGGKKREAKGQMGKRERKKEEKCVDGEKEPV